jgi:small subunit ribosomal protein S20
MPITKSAKKALRQNKTRRTRNVRKIVAYKASVKDFRKLVAAGKKDEAKKMLPKVYQILDKATKSGVIKKNKASRLKSNTSRLLQKTA